MGSKTQKAWVLAAIAISVFCIVAGLLVIAFPYARREIDYMAIGSVAVMLSILTIFSLTVSAADAKPRRRLARGRRQSTGMTPLGLELTS